MIFAFSDGVTIALITFVGGLSVIGAPIVMAAMTNRANRMTREQDWARQDKVADRAAKVAADVLAGQRLVLSGVIAANEKLVEVADVAKVTHALVNSDKTAQMREKRDDKIKMLLLIKELSDLKATLGLQPRADLLAAMAAAQIDIDALDAAINDRLVQQHAAEQQVAIDQKIAAKNL